MPRYPTIFGHPGLLYVPLIQIRFFAVLGRLCGSTKLCHARSQSSRCGLGFLHFGKHYLVAVTLSKVCRLTFFLLVYDDSPFVPAATNIMILTALVRIFFRLGSCYNRLSRRENESSRLGFTNTHDNGCKTLKMRTRRTVQRVAC